MTDLTDRMRTCAAAIVADDDHGDMRLVMEDAAALLIEASNALEQCEATGEACVPLGEPMEIIPPIVAQPQPPEIPTQVWTDLALPTLQRGGTISPRACPVCDSRANKTVRRVSCAMMITCQVCGHEWELKR